MNKINSKKDNNDNENFYVSLLNDIDFFYNKKLYSEAIELINSELKMPYIPFKIEKKLEKIKKKILIEYNEKNNKNLSFNDLINLILDKKNFEFSNEIIEKLNDYNLNNFFDEVEKILINKDVSFFIKLKLLWILKLQNVNYKKIRIFFDNKIKTIEIKQIKNILELESFKKDSRKIEDFLFKDLVILNSCLDLLERFYLVSSFLGEKTSDYYQAIIFVCLKLWERKDIQDKLINEITDIDIFNKKVNKIIEYNTIYN